MATSFAPSPYVKVRGHCDFPEINQSYSRLEEGAQEPVGPSFYLHSSAGQDRIPLYRYLNEDLGDVFLTTSWSELAYGYASWLDLGIIGYVYRRPTPGTVRLYRWFNDKTGRHFYTLIKNPPSLNLADGWTLEGSRMYVPEPSKTSSGRHRGNLGACIHSGCSDQGLTDQAEYCVNHLGPSELKSQLDSIIELDYASKIARVTEACITGMTWRLLYQRIRNRSGNLADWLVDLSGLVVSGDLVIDGVEDLSLDLSAARISGDLEIEACKLGRISLSGIKVNGSLIVRETLIRDGIFADHMVLGQALHLVMLTAKGQHAYFDTLRADRIEVSRSNLGVISFVGSTTSGRSAIDGTQANAVICTKMRAGQDWAIRQCSVSEYCGFRQASVAAHLHLGFSRFEGLVDLSGTQCGEAIHLADSRYAAEVILNGVDTPWLDMHNSDFQGRIRATELSVSSVLDIRNSEMREPVLLVSRPRAAICDDAVFHREASLQLSGTAVSAARTRFDSSSRIGAPAKLVKLLDLTDTDVSNVQLDQADLGFCCFAQTLNLESIQFVGAASFNTVPRHFGGSPWYRWRAARKVVWEEVLFRSARHTPGWSEWMGRLKEQFGAQPKTLFDWALEVPELRLGTEVTYRRLASVYRDLRRSQERNDEESESNEFYYSEMTIRRQHARGWRRAIFVLYWILGGYGVRPSRPLASFALLASLIAIALVQFGLLNSTAPVNTGHIGYAGALSYLLHSSTSLLGAPEFSSRGFGGLFLDLLARVLLPTLLVLALLGIRANVKRGR